MGHVARARIFNFVLHFCCAVQTVVFGVYVHSVSALYSDTMTISQMNASHAYLDYFRYATGGWFAISYLILWQCESALLHASRIISRGDWCRRLVFSCSFCGVLLVCVYFLMIGIWDLVSGDSDSVRSLTIIASKLLAFSLRLVGLCNLQFVDSRLVRSIDVFSVVMLVRSSLLIRTKGLLTLDHELTNTALLCAFISAGDLLFVFIMSYSLHTWIAARHFRGINGETLDGLLRRQRDYHLQMNFLYGHQWSGMLSELFACVVIGIAELSMWVWSQHRTWMSWTACACTCPPA